MPLTSTLIVSLASVTFGSSKVLEISSSLLDRVFSISLEVLSNFLKLRPIIRLRTLKIITIKVKIFFLR